MTGSDQDLGMHREITRRDFLGGVAVTLGAGMLSGSAVAQDIGAGPDPSPLDPLLAQGITPSDPRYYPPALTGMRGAHPGSFEAMHGARDGKSWDTPQETGETYDLVVVGGGISGLAAAYFFRKMAGPGARILVLDNHDDFGGHAKRNEFAHGSRTLMAPGGTTYLAQVDRWTFGGKTLLNDVGIDVNDPKHQDERDTLYSSLGLRAGVLFNKEQFGRDSMIVDQGKPPGWYASVPASADYLARTPLSRQVQRDYLRLFTEKRDYFPGLSREQKIRKLQKMSYRDYLLGVVKVHPDVLPLLLGVWCLNESSVSAWFAFFRSKPGFGGLGIDPPGSRPEDPNEGHVLLPGGNAELARMLVKWLIPDSLPGEVSPAPHSPADLIGQRLNYARLDQPGAPARIRLNSAAVRVKHSGPAVDVEDEITFDTREVEVTYVCSDKAYRVRGKSCVLACNNAAIPYLCPELPDKQKSALHMASRAVNLMVNVLIRDWTSFAKAGVSRVAAPWSFYPMVSLSEPVSYGSYRASRTPQEPMVVGLGVAAVLPSDAMVRGLLGGESLPLDMPVRDKMRVLRAAMYRTPFETFERNARDVMGRALAPGGFDPARDIEAITVNRWPHGYALGSNTLYDPAWTDDEVPWVLGKKPFGRITIANSDASGMDLSQSAIDEAQRAVDELEGRRQWIIRPRI